MRKRRRIIRTRRIILGRRGGEGEKAAAGEGEGGGGRGRGGGGGEEEEECVGKRAKCI
jgi:hypothetical protein